jgi:hypothetical protein
MSESREKGRGRIRVADITIAQLSRGLYRSTATALKELVNNAWDADATQVRIDTNSPEFDIISCVDNGTGMSLDEFRRFFKEEGVGSCVKRKHRRDRTDRYDRPIIGRLGIGMLAIGQLCHSFEIESHYIDDQGAGRAYRASILLTDVTIPDKEVVIRDDDAASKEVDVGRWEFEEIDYCEERQGFRIFSDDVRPTFRREMRDSITKKGARRLSFRLSDLHSNFYDKAEKSIRDCKAYLETIWELCVLCPVPYYGAAEEYPVDMELFREKQRDTEDFRMAREMIQLRQQKLLSYKFRVIFDGIELKRHIQLPTDRETIPKLYFLQFNEEVFDSQLRFEGYLFAQIPKAIRPFELNGVQIRVRNVGIGGYDPTFLSYSEQIETIRSRWVSGELFVDEGLESALNIDRDSFNEHDEHYKTLQSVLHQVLAKVFNEIDSIATVRRREISTARDKETDDAWKMIVNERSDGALKLELLDLGEDAPVMSLEKETGTLVLNTSVRPVGRQTADRAMRAALIAYHAAKQATAEGEERDRMFYELLQDMLRHKP